MKLAESIVKFRASCRTKTDDCVDSVADCGRNEDPSKKLEIPGICFLKVRLFRERRDLAPGRVAQLETAGKYPIHSNIVPNPSTCGYDD